MEDLSLDNVILTIAERLYHWSSDDCISILVQRDLNREMSTDNNNCYCYIILTPAPIANFIKLEDFKIRQVLCSTMGDTPAAAKRQLLDTLIEKAKDALAVPIEQIMNS
jgi:hypothetical protein